MTLNELIQQLKYTKAAHGGNIPVEFWQCNKDGEMCSPFDLRKIHDGSTNGQKVIEIELVETGLWNQILGQRSYDN